MRLRTLFLLILKVIGILFIKDILLSIPLLVTTLTSSLDFQRGGSFRALAIFLLSVGIYIAVAWYLLFNTEKIIDAFKLDAGFEVDAIRLNMHRSTILSICIIIIGGLMVAQAVPLFIRSVILFFQQSKYESPFTSPDKTYMIVYGLQIIAGLLLLGNQRQIVNFIESRRVKQMWMN